MAVKWFKYDRATRKEFVVVEFEKKFLKSMLANDFLSEKQKLVAYQSFLKYEKRSSLSYYRRYCMINFNGRAVTRLFKLHRLVCKKWANHGLLVGLRKASF